MASTVTIDSGQDGRGSGGDKFVRRGKMNLGVYATNGVAVTAAQLELVAVNDLQVQPAGGYVFEYVKSTGKVKAYVEEAVAAGGPLLELANTTDITAIEPRFRAEGI